MHYWPHRETLSFLDAHIRKRKRHGEAEAPEEADDVDASARDSPDDSLDDSSGADSKSGPEKAKAAKSKEFALNVPESKHQVKAAVAAQLNPLSQLPLSIVTQLAPVKPVQPVTQLAVVAGLPPGLKVSQASASAPQPLPVVTNATPSPAAAANLNGKTEEKEAPKSCEKAVRAFDEDELFLLSYVPALKRLTPQKRAAVKMQIQQIMFDAEFKDQ